MTDSTSQQVAEILHRIAAGGGSANELMPLLYRELRSSADLIMRRERSDHTLQPTALVNEAFVRLLKGQPNLGTQRHDFLAVAGRAMRNVLVDHARQHAAKKRGGSHHQVSLSGLVNPDSQTPIDVLALHEALEALKELDERQARIVELRFFAGMTGDEIAKHLDVHRNTVVRDLRMARAWLRRALDGADDSD